LKALSPGIVYTISFGVDVKLSVPWYWLVLAFTCYWIGSVHRNTSFCCHQHGLPVAEVSYITETHTHTHTHTHTVMQQSVDLLSFSNGSFTGGSLSFLL